MGDPLPGRVGEGRPPRSETRGRQLPLERELSTASGANDSTTAPNAAFHRKNPALVQRELSDITIASPARAKFRMTSDRYMNPNNAPSDFDKAMNATRESGASEYSEVRGGQLLYARRLAADKAACAATAPPQRPRRPSPRCIPGPRAMATRKASWLA